MHKYWLLSLFFPKGNKQFDVASCQPFRICSVNYKNEFTEGKMKDGLGKTGWGFF